MAYKLRDLRYQKLAVDPKVMLKNLKKDYQPKISVGIWCYTPGGGRFHDRFIPAASVPERIKMTYDMAKLGLTGIEAHYPDEFNEDNAHLYQKLERDTGIKLVGVPFSHFFDKRFEFGSLSNPDKKVRQHAREITIRGLKLIKELGAYTAVSWPGMDGYRYLHGKPFMNMWQLYESTVAEAMDEVPGVRISIEPKGYEPAPNNIYRTTAEGILAAKRIESLFQNPINKKLVADGQALVALNPEIGHVKMSFEMLPAAYSLVCMEGRLAHTHWNSQPDGNYDQDNNVGVVNPHETEALLYSLWAIGYEEYFGIDINPENMPILKAVDLNIKAIKKMKDRIARLPHEKIIECHLNPAQHRGELEEILIKNL